MAKPVQLVSSDSAQSSGSKVLNSCSDRLLSAVLVDY